MEAVAPPERRVASRADLPGLTLAALALMGFAGLAILRHWNLHSHAFDLGYYQQVVWNTAHGDWWRVTLLVNLERGFLHHLGGHVELILFPIAIAYRILPLPEFLLALQGAALAAGGWVLWRLARRWGLAVVPALAGQCLYYVHPSVLGPALFDFHPLVFASPLLMAAVWAVEARRPAWFLGLAIAALACREQVALYVVGLAVLAVWRTRGRWWRMASGVGLVSIAWFAACLIWIMPAHNPSGHSQHFAPKFGHLGATPGEAAVAMLRDPGSVARLAAEPERRGYLRAMAGYGGVVLYLGAPWALLPALPELAVNVLSRVYDQRVHHYQYSATLAGSMILATIAAVSALGRRARATGWVRTARLLPVAASIACLVASLAMHRRQYGSFYALQADLTATYRPNPRGAAARAMVASIPDAAVVCAQSDMVPHLANRRTIYVFPFVNDADYVLLDRHGETFPLTKEAWAQWFARWSADPRLELVEERDGFILLGRKGRPA